MSILSTTGSKTKRIAPSSESQPIPAPAGALARLTQRLARLSIREASPLESTLQSRVTIGQAPPNSPRESCEEIFSDVFESDFKQVSDNESSRTSSTVREEKTDDFEILFTSRSFVDSSVTQPQPQSSLGVEECLETDDTILRQLSTPRTAPTLFPVANPGTLDHMPSPPLAPIKKRPPSAQSSSSEIIPETKDASKKRAREVEEAPRSENPRRVRARLMLGDLPSEEKKDVPPLDFEPFEKKIDVMPSLPFCATDQIRMFYNLIIHPTTQVWSGMDGNEGCAGKIASFLPLQIDKDQFKMLLEQAVSSGNGCIVHQENKGLFQLEMNGTVFVIEVTLLDGKIFSVQPIFHCENYDHTKKSIRVDYLSQSFGDDPIVPGVYELPYSNLLDLVKAHLSAPSFNFPIAYETKDTLFVDLAILDEKCPFSKGLIIIAIPKIVVENRMSF